MIFNSEGKKSWKRHASALLGAGAILAVAGCGGGSSNNGGNNGGGGGNTANNSALPSVPLVALTLDNRLITFNARTPGTSTIVTVGGLTTGDILRAIDFRFAAPSTIAGNGQTGLYAIGRNNNTQQLYRLAISGSTATATPVGARFRLITTSPIATSFGFDFNPTVDRIRLIEPVANRNLRLNPNAADGASPVVDSNATAEGTQPDGTLSYAASDANNGDNPDAVGAAYTNADADATTGTTLYVLDAAQNTLAIQGRADDPATVGVDETVSPNSGTLFTVANLGIDITADTGFDISPTGNAAFISNGNRIYGVSLTSGAVVGGASVADPLGTAIIGLAASS
ncbi:MAG TPA: DUF4394 domain-containing protein [Abditibacterium sp.]|jgi:hypothetical protein